MEIILTDWRGAQYEAARVEAWSFTRTGGNPCDSFSVRFFTPDVPAELLRAAVRLTAREGGATRFFGVVDEFRLTQDESGRTATVLGRGLAALLLDSEALPRVYSGARMGDILKNHVAPYGIKTAGAGPAGRASLSVESGMSEWDALAAFCEAAGGAEPFFEADGTLRLAGAPETGIRVVGADAPILRAALTGERCGVLSEAVVRDRYCMTSVRARDEAFLREGGRRRKLFTMPGHSDAAAMLAQAKKLLRESAADRETAEITLAGAFFADAGERIRLAPAGLGELGLFRVTQAVSALDGDGARTRLRLRRVD